MFSCFLFIALKIGNLEKNVQNLKVQLAGAHGNHKEAMDQVDCWVFFFALLIFTCVDCIYTLNSSKKLEP